MNMHSKNLEDISIEEFQTHPVWRFSSRPEQDDTQLVPVKRLPCTHLRGKVVFAQVELANGLLVWACLDNLDLSNPELTEHFLTLSIYRDGKWFHLARYHDFHYNSCGPKQLAAFLGIDEHNVFPIRYDIRNLFPSTTDGTILKGTIKQEPKTKLTRSEIIALAVPKRSKK